MGKIMMVRTREAMKKEKEERKRKKGRMKEYN